MLDLRNLPKSSKMLLSVILQDIQIADITAELFIGVITTWQKQVAGNYGRGGKNIYSSRLCKLHG
jgi:hypothetical protein